MGYERDYQRNKSRHSHSIRSLPYYNKSKITMIYIPEYSDEEQWLSKPFYAIGGYISPGILITLHNDTVIPKEIHEKMKMSNEINDVLDRSIKAVQHLADNGGITINIPIDRK